MHHCRPSFARPKCAHVPANLFSISIRLLIYINTFVLYAMVGAITIIHIDVAPGAVIIAEIIEIFEMERVSIAPLIE